MRALHLLGFLVLSFFMLSCQTKATAPDVERPINPEIRNQQEQSLKPAQDKLALMDFKEAILMYTAFQKKYPSGYYYQMASLGLAQAWEGLGDWQKSAEIYREVVSATRGSQPVIAAQALYLSSFSYEAIGDETRVLSSLKDAEVLAEYLTDEQRLAELPARLSAFYQRVGQTKEAQKYLVLAEHGLRQLQARQTATDPVWLSKTLFMMGQFQINQVSHENLQSHIDTLSPLQVFLLRSVESGGVPWAKLAKESLMQAYLSIWNTVQAYPATQSLEQGAAAREKLDRQLYFVGEMLRLQNELRDLELPDANTDNQQLVELSDFMGDLYTKGREFLLTKVNFLPLTRESLNRMGLRREGLVLSEPFFDIEKRAPDMPTQLPNKSN